MFTFSFSMFCLIRSERKSITMNKITELFHSKLEPLITYKYLLFLIWDLHLPPPPPNSPMFFFIISKPNENPAVLRHRNYAMAHQISLEIIHACSKGSPPQQLKQELHKPQKCKENVLIKGTVQCFDILMLPVR